MVEDRNRSLGYHFGRDRHDFECNRAICRHLRLVLSLLEAGLLPARGEAGGLPSVLRGAPAERRAEHDRLPASGRGAVRALGGRDARRVPVRAEADRVPPGRHRHLRGARSPAGRPAGPRPDPRRLRPGRRLPAARARLGRPGPADRLRLPPRLVARARDQASGERRPRERPRRRRAVSLLAAARTALRRRRAQGVGRPHSAARRRRHRRLLLPAPRGRADRAAIRRAAPRARRRRLGGTARPHCEPSFPRQLSPLEIAEALDVAEADIGEQADELRRCVDAHAERDCAPRPVGEDDVIDLDFAGDRIELSLFRENAVVLERLPATRLEDRHQPVAMKRLDDEGTPGPQHPRKLAQHSPVSLFAAVADRAEEVEDGVEARIREGELAEVSLHPPRPSRVAHTAAAFRELHRRAVHDRHPVAGLGERKRMPAETPRRVEDLGRRLDTRQRRRSPRLPGGIGLAEPQRIGPEVDLVEELVPVVGPHPDQSYSYCSACRTFSRAARRAGSTAATIPTMIVTTAKRMSCPVGILKLTSYWPRACTISAARKTPSGSPRAAPISAVMMLSWRIIRRTWRRVIPTARSIPSSRVRSKTESTSVLMIPKMLTTTESARSTYSMLRNCWNSLSSLSTHSC